MISLNFMTKYKDYDETLNFKKMKPYLATLLGILILVIMKDFLLR